MERESISMDKAQKKPVVLAFAGPNGSGKSTITRALKPLGTYVNADDIKMEYGLSDLEAAMQAESLRSSLLERNIDFSFETVLSTDRNLLLLEKAHTQGYEVQCIYVLTCDENINVARVRARVTAGGHDVSEEKIRTRYHRALSLLPRLVKICDVLLVYDNTAIPTLIFSKQGSNVELFYSDYWTEAEIRNLLEL